MFGLFSRLRKKPAVERQETPPPSAVRTTQKEEKPAVTIAPAPPVPRPSAPTSKGGTLTLPLSAIIKNLPKELQGKMSATAVAGLSFSISLDRVLDQLPQGAVKVPLRELREATPAGVFVNSPKHDDELIALPFAEVLSQLPPGAFVRRQHQKAPEPTADIPDIFGNKGAALAQVRVLSKHEVGPQPAPQPAPEAPAPAKSKTPSPPPAKSPSPVQTKVSTPAAPAKTAARAQVKTAEPAPGSRVPAPDLAAALEKAATRTAPAPGAQAPPSPASQTAQKRPITSAPSTPIAGPVLSISLASLSEKWPEPIRAEIERLKVTRSSCEFSLAEIGAALKTGKVQYSWSQIRSHLKPALPDSSPSQHAETVLDLPLKIVAPAYLEHSRESQPGKKVSVARDIPDVFKKSAAPDTTSASAPPQSVVEESPAPAEDAPEITQPALTLPLSLVCENWPDAVRKEIDLFNLASAKLEVPLNLIEEGLKQGRLQFRWRQVSHWLKPSPSTTLPSSTLGTQLDYRVDLPLNFVTPLYLKQRGQPPESKKAAVAADIPDIFHSASPAPESRGSAVSPAVSADPHAASTGNETKKPTEDLAQLFGEPEKRNWTPNDIVHKTATLPGVAGALIALQDGLLVASCMPPDWKTETIAAFLPQIFGRMTQYTNELKMGELKSVTLAVDQGTFQIFNAGIIYFAALGQADQTLPVPELNLIAKEIGRHTK